MSSIEMQQEALHRAKSGQSILNEAIVIGEFIARGIPQDQIAPRDNCLTFHAWKALGRSVKKGEHGVRIVTWIPTRDKDEEGRETSGKLRPKTAFVFHVSQTQESRS